MTLCWLLRTGWKKKRFYHWKTLFAARAIGKSILCRRREQSGEDAAELQYSGNSAVIDALGNDVSGINSSDYYFCKDNNLKKKT